MPEQVNGFSKQSKTSRLILYENDTDGTVVTATKSPGQGGDWSVVAQPEGTGSKQTLAEGVASESDAMAVAVEFMESYQPVTPATDGGAVLPETVNGFSLEDDGKDTFLYTNSDADVSVSAATAPGGSWVVTAVAPGSAGGTIAKGLSGKSAAKDTAVDYMEDYPTGDGTADASLPKTLNGFKLEQDRPDEVIYEHTEDGTVVSADANAGDTFSVRAFPADSTGSRQLARQVELSSAVDVMKQYMERYTPVDGDGGGGGGMGEMMDKDADGGVLSRLADAGRSAADRATTALEPSDDDGGDRSASGLFDGTGDDGPSAFERFGDGRDRSAGPV
jgi:hypothetical protein